MKKLSAFIRHYVELNEEHFSEISEKFVVKQFSGDGSSGSFK